ncbi:MAG TPA: glycoside hydrolase family 3 C-terminal domain-containing protein, partial [Cellulomonas sp.]
ARSGTRALATQLRFDAAHPGDRPALDVVASTEHRALAREAAALSMVLLRNEAVDGVPVLPLDARALRRLAVVGRLADVANTGDHGSSDVRAPEVVTALAGLRSALPGVEVVHVADDDPAEAARVAATCDAAVVVAGYTADDEGEYADTSAMTGPAFAALFPPPPEGSGSAPTDLSVAGGNAAGAGGDRVRLTLRDVDEEIVRAVGAANPRTVVALVAAGAVLTESWRTAVPGVLMSWYSGMAGGHALADVLLGRVDASGRLPFSIPTSEEHLPCFDRDATAITYDRWHGQRLLDHLGVEAAFPLGFGLSYTSFTIGAPEVKRTGAESASVTVEVTNTGGRSGRHVVQVYGTRGDGGERFLLGFAPVELAAGAAAAVEVPVSLRPLTVWDDASRTLVLTPGDVEVIAAAYAGDPAATSTVLALA